MESIRIRLARPEDADALLAIYIPYVTGSSITFEYEPPSTEEFARRIREISAHYPYLIAERDGLVLGYAYAGAYRSRAAYSWDVELSIYLRPEAQGCGAAGILYGALLELLRAQGVYNAYACITHPNERSEHFHRARGFRTVGVFSHAGYKFGAWRDVIWMEKALRESDGEPLPVVPVDRLDPTLVNQILNRAS